MQGTQTTAETKRNISTNKTTTQQRKQHETTTQTKQRNNSTTTTAQQDETTARQTQACGIARARLPKVLPRTPVTSSGAKGSPHGSEGERATEASPATCDGGRPPPACTDMQLYIRPRQFTQRGERLSARKTAAVLAQAHQQRGERLSTRQ